MHRSRWRIAIVDVFIGQAQEKMTQTYSVGDIWRVLRFLPARSDCDIEDGDQGQSNID